MSRLCGQYCQSSDLATGIRNISTPSTPPSHEEVVDYGNTQTAPAPAPHVLFHRQYLDSAAEGREKLTLRDQKLRVIATAFGAVQTQCEAVLGLGTVDSAGVCCVSGLDFPESPKHFEAPCENHKLKLVYELRNEFFREALCDEATCGLIPKPSRLFHAVNWFDLLNSRLIDAITGYRNVYKRSGWRFLGCEAFGKSSLHQDIEDGSR
jgi:hypothetical protein